MMHETQLILPDGSVELPEQFHPWRRLVGLTMPTFAKIFKHYNGHLQTDWLGFANIINASDSACFLKDNAFLLFTGIRPGFDAEVHGGFFGLPTETGWDKPTATLYLEVMKQFNLKTLRAYIAKWNKPARKYVERLGFRYEGALHRRLERNDRLWSLLIFDLPVEVLEKEVKDVGWWQQINEQTKQHAPIHDPEGYPAASA